MTSSVSALAHRLAFMVGIIYLLGMATAAAFLTLLRRSFEGSKKGPAAGVSLATRPPPATANSRVPSVMRVMPSCLISCPTCPRRHGSGRELVGDSRSSGLGRDLRHPLPRRAARRSPSACHSSFQLDAGLLRDRLHSRRCSTSTAPNPCARARVGRGRALRTRSAFSRPQIDRRIELDRSCAASPPAPSRPYQIAIRKPSKPASRRVAPPEARPALGARHRERAQPAAQDQRQQRRLRGRVDLDLAGQVSMVAGAAPLSERYDLVPLRTRMNSSRKYSTIPTPPAR